MKKEDVSGIIVYLLIVGIALVFCFTVLREHSGHSNLEGFAYWGYIVGAVVAGIVFNAALFELAHMAGAKAGRYEIISVCILGLTFYKFDGKRRVKFANFDGLTGETKILPRTDVEKIPNPRPYLLFGSLFFLVEAVGCVIAFTLLNTDSLGVSQTDAQSGLSNVGHFLLTMAVVGGVILLYNIIPLRLDSITDGYRLTMVTNPKNKEAFNELLRVEYEISQGNSDVEIKTFENITNFTADLNLNKVYALLDKREFDEAEKLLDIILAGKEELSHRNYLRALAQKIFIHLLNKTPEEAREYYDNEVDLRIVREISQDDSMPSIRTYILVCGLIDRSRSEAALAIDKVSKAYKRTPKNRRPTEARLYNEAIDRIIEFNPKWEEFKDYKLEIVEESKPKKKDKEEQKEDQE